MYILRFLQCCLCADGDDMNKRSGAFHRQAQKLLMQEVLSTVNMHFIDVISNGKPQSDICGKWQGITCRRGLVCEMEFTHRQVGNFQIEYLPKHLRKLDLSYCHQKYSLCPRRFPSEIVEILLSTNNLFGTVEISSFPPKVKRINLANNCLVGPIRFVDSPPNIVDVHLEDNRIQQNIVFYSGIPQSARHIHVQAYNRIGRIEPIDECDRVMGSIFIKLDRNLTEASMLFRYGAELLQ